MDCMLHQHAKSSDRAGGTYSIPHYAHYDQVGRSYSGSLIRPVRGPSEGQAAVLRAMRCALLMVLGRAMAEARAHRHGKARPWSNRTESWRGYGFLQGRTQRRKNRRITHEIRYLRLSM